MKAKHIFLSLILCCVAVFSPFALAGCDEVSLGTLKENFAAYNAAVEAYTQQDEPVFSSEETSRFVVSTYGDFVDDKIGKKEKPYLELKTLYNASLVIATDYVDAYCNIILENVDETKLTKETKNAIKSLNATVLDCTSSLKNFVQARKDFLTHFENHSSVSETANAQFLLRFKDEFGAFVENNVNLCTNLAKTIQSTEIFDILQKTEPTKGDTQTLKDYTLTKLLPLFTRFKISEVFMGEKDWSKTEQTETKTQIDGIISKLDAAFESFQTNFIQKSVKTEPISKEEFKQVFDLIEMFDVEAENYFQALGELDLKKLAVSYKNNMQNYVEANQFAEVYLQKVQQFVEISLPKFVEHVSAKLLQG